MGGWCGQPEDVRVSSEVPGPPGGSQYQSRLLGDDRPVTEESEWLASLRPSRIREVQAGATSWTSVHLVDVEFMHADALRQALETFGVGVTRTSVGQSRHLVEALAGGHPAPFVLLACHGDEGRIVLPELAPEVERYQPFHGGVTPEDLGSFARFEGATVIATGCDTGHPGLVDAVLGAGAGAYLAPTGAPFGYASFFAPVFLFYELTQLRSLDEAVRRLAAHDRELGMWRLYR